MKKILQLIILFLAIIGYGQNWTEIIKLETSDQQSDDNHAISVAIDGEYAIAGAWHQNFANEGSANLSNAGAAYIYHYNSSTEVWEEEAKLVAADREAGDEFGISVAISGTYAVIGAVVEDGARGAAYVFEKDSGSGLWIQVAKLVAPFQQSSDRFGVSVAMDENTIIVGAQHEDENENETDTKQNAGSAYIFTRENNTWSLYQKIVASDRDSNDNFGYSVGIHNENIIVGAYKYDPDGIEIGGAYVFDLGNGIWEETTILKASTSYQGDRFGWSVDVYNDFYIVGAPYHDYDDLGGGFHNNAGAAYIYDAANSWAEDKVVEGDRTDQDNLGEDVAIYETTVVVGAPLQDYGIDGDPPFWSSGGAAFVYEKEASGIWNQTQKLLTGDRFTSDKFGHSVAIYEDTIIGGAPEDNGTIGPSTGSLYVFKDETLGVNDNDFNTSISLYPNPTKDIINIHLGKYYNKVIIQLTNYIGQVILNKTIQNAQQFTLQMERLETGLYIAEIITNTGRHTTIKIIKK